MLKQPDKQDLTNENLNIGKTEGEATENLEKEVRPEWTARIANLRAIAEPPTELDLEQKRWWGVVVDLKGWALLFTIGTALLFQAIYFHLLSRAGIISLRPTGVLLAVGCGFLAFARSTALARATSAPPFADPTWTDQPARKAELSGRRPRGGDRGLALAQRPASLQE